jgi:small subunit ribosomal protein S6
LKAYECLYLVHPAAQTVELQASAEKYGKIIADNGGTLKETDIWGKRQLAYRIQKESEANYILLRFDGVNETLAELEHNLRVDDRIFRHMVTYEVPEGTGRSEKLMAITERKERPRRGGRRRFRDDYSRGPRQGGRRDEESDRRDEERGARAPAESAPPESAPAPATDSAEATKPEGGDES